MPALVVDRDRPGPAQAEAARRLGLELPPVPVLLDRLRAELSREPMASEQHPRS